MQFFDLSPEQLEMREVARTFASEVMRPAAQTLDRSASPPQQSELFWDVLRQAAEVGFQRMAFPASVGGLGLDPITIAVILEELARGDAGLASTIFSNVSLSTAAHFGSPEVIAKYVVPFCEDRTGRMLAAGAMTEPSSGSDSLNFTLADDPRVGIQTTARREGDTYVLNGRKCFTTNGGIATVYSILAREDRARGMTSARRFIVPAEAEGLSVGRFEDKLGWRCSVQGELVLHDVRIPADHLLPASLPFPSAIRHGLGVSMAFLAAAATGVAQAALEAALRYTGERVQGGKLLREHQAVALKLGRMAMQVESARATYLRASVHHATSSSPDFRVGTWAKIVCARTATDVASAAVDLFGGYGCMKDFPIEKLYRDARVFEVVEGTADFLCLLTADGLHERFD